MHPWGVAEARALDVYDVLVASRAHEVRWWRNGLAPGDARSRRNNPVPNWVLSFYHPEMQGVLLAAAEAAGAAVRGGWSVVRAIPGRPASVVARAEGHEQVWTARLILTELLYEVGPEADARRGRVFARLAQRPEPVLDIVGLGPDPGGVEEVRRRLFADD